MYGNDDMYYNMTLMRSRDSPEVLAGYSRRYAGRAPVTFLLSSPHILSILSSPTTCTTCHTAINLCFKPTIDDPGEMRRSLSITKNFPHHINHVVFTRRAGQAAFSHLSRRAFAQVRDDHEQALSDGWFASNTHLAPTSIQERRSEDIKPVDERTLKLGKSMSPHNHHYSTIPSEPEINMPTSTPNPPRHPPQTPRNSPSPRTPLALNLPPPLPLYTSPPTHRFRQARIQRRSLDCTSSVGSYPCRWERAPHYPLGALD